MMRIWGRPQGSAYWQAVETAPNGDNSYVYVTNLAQVILLNPGESPFFANYGLGGQASIISQIQPDLDMVRTARQFSPFFANLLLSKTSSSPPTYRINVLTKTGAVVQGEIAV